MCDQTTPYSFGTLVWYKAANRVWWPGKIVDPKQTPESIQDFMNTRKNPIGVVFFEREKYYDVITNMNKVFLYNCSKKLDFIEKGYHLYLKQIKMGNKKPFDMSIFVDDVLQFEREIGGNLNIFEQFEVNDKKYQETKEVVKELFSTAKVGRKSLKTPNSILPRTSKTPITSKSKTVLSKTTKHIPSAVDSSARFKCSIIKGCNYKTNSYECLKRHMSDHNKNKDKDCDQIKPSSSGKKSVSQNKGSNTKALFQTSKKRKNVKSKHSDAKKIKLQDELLKDWSDSDDQDETIGVKATPTSSTVNDIVTNTIFNSDEDSNETSVNITDLQRDRVDTSDELSESFHERSTPELPELIYNENNTKNQSCNLENNTDDQIESTILLENTEDTLDQINRLEESLSGMSSNANKSDINILPEDGSVIPVIDTSQDEHSLNKDVQNDTVKSEHVLENLSIPTKNNVTEEDTTNDSSEIADSSKVQKLNGNNNDDSSLTDMDIENGSNVYNSNVNTVQVQNKVDVNSTEDDRYDCNTVQVQNKVDVNSTEDDRYDCNTVQVQNKVNVNSTEDRYDCLLSRLPTPDWAKENSWDTFPQNGLNEAKLFTTIDKQKKLTLDLPPMETTSSQSTPIYIDEIESTDDISEYYMIRAPIKPRKYTNEELLAMPEVKIMREAMISQPGSVKFKIIDGKILRPPQ